MTNPAPPAVAWITGASGGIGLATAERLADAGMRLVLHAGRRPDGADTLARRFGPLAEIYVAEITDADAHRAALDRAVARFGRIDVCVPNAGIWPHEDRPLVDMPTERIRRVLSTNLEGALVTARTFLECLRRCGPRCDGRGASLCFVGSTAGRFGEPYHVAYAASKGALRAIVGSLAREIVDLDPRGRVNMVEPGWTATPMAAAGLGDDDAVRRAVATMPLARVARPEDVAHAIAFLCDLDRAAHVTGEILTVAGGMQGRLVRAPSDVDPAAIRGEATKTPTSRSS
ncbi:MAG: SDR family oxidoreductase [Deltaproteobacteria bacterium]|nr:MAG: SDR family oxidoreductase [Deltaproteobacteria bacterium]